MNDKALGSGQIWRHTGRLILVDPIERELADGVRLGACCSAINEIRRSSRAWSRGIAAQGPRAAIPRLLL
jgi:hypothetical protein